MQRMDVIFNGFFNVHVFSSVRTGGLVSMRTGLIT